MTTLKIALTKWRIGPSGLRKLKELELIKIHEVLNAKISELEGRSRRDNIRIHGIAEGAEDGSPSVPDFIKNLLREKLDLPQSLDLTIDIAHRSLGLKPPPEAPPRSVVIKFSLYRTKDEVLKRAWQRKGFTLNEKKVIIDHDYAPDVLKKRREYNEAKRVLRENNIRFQTPYPARLRVFYEGDTRVYSTAAEATKDMASRGHTVTIITPQTSLAEKLKGTMWHKVARTEEARDESSTRGYKKRLEAFRRQ
ncbi:unnamed protein product [Knipowitschia caucasica]